MAARCLESRVLAASLDSSTPPLDRGGELAVVTLRPQDSRLAYDSLFAPKRRKAAASLAHGDCSEGAV
jgi:hypothetical protein